MSLLAEPLNIVGIQRFDRIQIGEALVHSCQFEEALDAITRIAVEGGPPSYVVTPNAQHIVLLAGDRYLRQIYSEAALVLPDGISLVHASRLLGGRIPCRVTGVDLFEALCARAAFEGLSVFLLGGRPGSAERTAMNLQSRYSGLIVSGICCPPFGFEKDESQQRKVEDCILAAKPDLLFVGLGAPKQEYWMHRYARTLGVPVSMGVGGSFEMVGGAVRRAPAWIRNLGCEWLHRLLSEPNRMWRRYLIGNLQFVFIVLLQKSISTTPELKSGVSQQLLRP